MGIKFLKHKWQKRLLIFSLIFLGIILIFSFLVNLYWSPILAGKVKSTVLTSSDSLYTIEFSDAKLHIIRGEIDIYNITLKPDTAVYNRRKKNHLAPNNLVELHVKRIVLSHIHPFKLYFQHKLDIGKVILKEPELNVSYQLNHTKDTTIKDRRTTWQKMSKSLKSIHIGEILLNDVKFKYEDYSGNKMVISELKEMNLSANDLLIDSTTQTDKSRLLYCKNILTELNNYSGKTADGLYVYRMKSMRLSTQTSKLNIEGLDLQPVKADVFFDKSMHDRFKIHLDSFQLNNFDFVSYHKYRILRASNMVLSHGSVDIFNNPNKKPSEIDKVKTFPNFGLEQLKADLTIDTIKARHINVSYTEFNKKSNKSGTITFNNTSAQFLNVTTNKPALQKNNIITAQISSYFMNTGKVDATFTFNLTDKNFPFSYKGSLGPMNLQSVNPAIIPLALIKFNQGTVTRMDFDINADSKISKGKVAILYKNLKVTVLKADTDNDRLKHMTIASLYANLLVIKRNNPDNEGELPRSFYVTYKRPKNDPFFKTIWHTLLDGIKPCAGLDEKMQQNVKATLNEYSQRKQEHKVKKALRIQRREERKRKRALKKENKALAN
ncbi:MAG: hypothetical protein JWP37_3335 [Mucilaginibacter sp.]|nr:hypothetical protein [Mucilaginibacter sp.]